MTEDDYNEPECAECGRKNSYLRTLTDLCRLCALQESDEEYYRQQYPIITKEPADDDETDSDGEDVPEPVGAYST